MFEAYLNDIKLNVLRDNVEFDLRSISEKLCREIAFQDEDGWIKNSQ